MGDSSIKDIVSFLVPNEQVLIEGLRAGYEESFRALYRIYSNKIFRLAWHFLGDEDEAKNIVQETFIVVFRKVHNFRQDAALGTWIYKVASNLCLKELARRKRRMETHASFARELAFERQSEHPLEMLARSEMARMVQAHIDRLDDLKRMTFLLFYVEEMTADEIAEVLGEGRGTVLKRLQRVREEIRKAIAHDPTMRYNTKDLEEGLP